MRLVRAAGVILALIVAAWFGLGVRQATDTSRATKILSAGTPVSTRQATRVGSLLDEAGTLNPDRQVDLLRGQLALEQGHPRQAQRLIEAVTRAEPQNLAAWLSLARAATDDIGLFERALTRVRRLEPLLPAH